MATFFPFLNCTVSFLPTAAGTSPLVCKFHLPPCAASGSSPIVTTPPATVAVMPFAPTNLMSGVTLCPSVTVCAGDVVESLRVNL